MRNKRPRAERSARRTTSRTAPQCCEFGLQGGRCACEINAHFRSAAWAVQVNIEIWGRGGHLTFGCVCLRWAFFSLAPESNGPLTRPAWGFPRCGATFGETLRRSVTQRPASSSPWLARSASVAGVLRRRLPPHQNNERFTPFSNSQTLGCTLPCLTQTGESFLLTFVSAETSRQGT